MSYRSWGLDRSGDLGTDEVRRRRHAAPAVRSRLYRRQAARRLVPDISRCLVTLAGLPSSKYRRQQALSFHVDDHRDAPLLVTDVAVRSDHLQSRGKFALWMLLDVLQDVASVMPKARTSSRRRSLEDAQSTTAMAFAEGGGREATL